MIPERITDTLIKLLSTQRLKPVIVLHCNHVNEIDNEVQHAVQKMNRAGITLLDQTVLLKGINDDASTLLELNKKLFHTGVTYYLHLLDPQGAAHFDVKETEAIELSNNLVLNPGLFSAKISTRDRWTT